MGFYDRDYERDDTYDRTPGFEIGGGRTLTTNLVILMVAIYVIQLATRGNPPGDGAFTDLFSLHARLFVEPWRFFELVTYGFLHDPWHFQHILFNMIGLWFFGRSVEYRYGKREFLAFFLLAIVAAGLSWIVSEFVANGTWTRNQMLGASGGIAAVLVVFCLNFPHQLVYIWGVLPIPAWAFAILFIVMDLWGAFGGSSPDGRGSNVAYTAHLGGVVFGFLYYQSGLRVERFIPGPDFFKRLKPKPKLRVHDPENADETERQVDEILKKIQEQGRDSLTRRERKLLEQASREYQKRRH